MTQILYNRAVKLFVDKISAGFDEYGAHEIVANKYGKPVADKILSEAKSLEKQISRNPRTKIRILRKTDKPTNIKKILKEIDETANELRFRMRNPNKFNKNSFRRKQITKGVSIILGCPKENGTSFWDGKCKEAMETQALRFDRQYFTPVSAAKWISENTQLKYGR